MIWEKDDQSVALSYGPMQMKLDISVHGRKQPELGFVVAGYLIEQLKQLSEYMPQLKAMRAFEGPRPMYPPVLNKMIAAVGQIGDPELNTLSAVAGAFSETALNMALKLGASRVIVNNGGDIAMRDVTGAPIFLGIRRDIREDKPAMVLKADEQQRIFGACTSGFGGRSFTKGIASAVTVLAQTASAADACATYIANRTNADDPHILRCRADEIDSGTDIPGQTVTMKIGAVSARCKQEALSNGVTAARMLYDSSIIKGAVIFVKGEMRMWPEDGSIFQYERGYDDEDKKVLHSY